MLVSAKKILEKANQDGYAVGAFNTNNLETTQAIIESAEELKAPVIIQTSEGAISYAGLEFLFAINKIASQAKVPVAIHLDHGKDLKLIKKCIDLGYTSVMYDGSSLPEAKNIDNTTQVVAWAHKKGVSVEAEIGALAGIEDFVSVSAKEAALTSPEQALNFAQKTKCDSLAIAIGTAHGAFKFKGECHLDFERLKKIKAITKLPLVLHGASGVPAQIVKLANQYGAKLADTKGVPDSQIKQAIKYGINKINTDTDLRIAFTAGLRQALAQNPSEIDPRKILGPAKDLMKQIIKQRIHVFGSVNKGR